MYPLAKRGFDLLVAGSALIVLSPILGFIAFRIRSFDGGPVLYAGRRVGLHGRPFGMYKFRSMVLNADKIGGSSTPDDDPRITPVGRFLRRTSIDELPQLFNVLRGEMAMVGPRPHVPGMLATGVPYTTLVPYYPSRLHMTPGMTGWAQANGYRGETTQTAAAVGRIAHDLAYIQNFTLALDLVILWRTLRREFLTGTGI